MSNIQEKVSSWPEKVKLGCYILIGMIVYTYLLMFAESFYFKTKHQDKFDAMAVKTEKLMHDLHMLDQNIRTQMEYIDELYTEYE